MLSTLSAMLRKTVKTDAAAQAIRDVNRQRVPAYQADLTMIQNTFMATLKEVKKEIGSDFTAVQTLTKEVTQEMFAALTKGQDIQRLSVTPEDVAAAITQSVSGMEGTQPEALDKLGQALAEFFQSTIDQAQEQPHDSPEQ